MKTKKEMYEWVLRFYDKDLEPHEEHDFLEQLRTSEEMREMLYEEGKVRAALRHSLQNWFESYTRQRGEFAFSADVAAPTSREEADLHPYSRLKGKETSAHSEDYQRHLQKLRERIFQLQRALSEKKPH